MNRCTGLNLIANNAAPILVRGNERVTHAELHRWSDELLALLKKNCVRRVLIRCDDPSQLIRSIDACSRAGADLYIAHTNIPENHLGEIYEKFAIQLLIGDRGELRPLNASAATSNGQILIMTSGTTSRPKIAAHTLDSLLGRIRMMAQPAECREGRWLLTYQPTGFAGLQVLLTAIMTRGLLVVPEQRTIAEFYKAALQADVTHISGTPTFWRAFLMLLKPGALKLKQITLGGEACDQTLLNRLKQSFPGVRITHTYASTEAGVAIAVHDGIEGFPSAWLENASRSIQLRIRDGFLQIRTPNAMCGYVSEAVQPMLDGGWLSTADRCRVDGDRVKVLGREDSAINVGGSKVYPLAIEAFLLSLPEVAEARVYGLANPITGNLVAADAILTADTDPASARKNILLACHAKLASYQVPRIFRIVETIAVADSGKKG